MEPVAARPEDKTLYVKRGRRYMPALEHTTYDFMAAGHYLLTVKPGSKQLTLLLTPDEAPLKAALRHPIDVLAQLLVEASKGRPMREPITQKQRDAWDRFVKDYKDVHSIMLPSAHEIAEKFLAALVEYKP
jgi:hypothetical protein